MSAGQNSKQDSLLDSLRSYRKEIRFLFLFVLLLAFLNLLYFLCGGTALEHFVLGTITAKPVYVVIKLLTPSEQVVLNGTLLTSAHVNFEIVRGCEGMEGMLLMISAMCAFSLAWTDKLKGIFCGIVFIYIFNLLRIIGLYYLMRYYATAFNFAHLFVGQSITIVLVSVFFILWISRSMKKDEKNSAG